MNLEAEYNNRARVADHPQFIAGWARDAAAYRQKMAGMMEIGTAYGKRDRERYDFFGASTAPEAPIFVFIHGGYWQALDRSSFSHMAAGVNAHGYSMAIAGYDLCPDVPLGVIVGQMRALTLHLWTRFEKRIVVVGHSAGGHLAACLLATDWSSFNKALPSDLVPAAYSLSGLFELEPLVGTSINGALKLDPGDARIWSPALWRAPKSLILDAVVGSEESSEFRRQSRDIAEKWAAKGVKTRYEEIAGAHHFSVLAPLADPTSAASLRLIHLARHL